MNTLVDTHGQAIARRVQLERKARGWSMTELSARSDVSKAAISKIERGEMSPTANVLVRLAHAFELTLAGLLMRAEQQAGAVQRAADQPLWEDPETHYVRRQVFRASDNPIEMARIYLPPGAKVTIPSSGFTGIREVLHVLDGALTLTFGSTVHSLETGDSIALEKTADVIFENPGANPCAYIVALVRRGPVTPPLQETL
ncbi:MAG: helix-turn-helix transcriptional regulator [Devosiaceae bacterium]|nr:helix-turn-helix transcriptional regulator [Devosiaceae bacterium MH13]